MDTILRPWLVLRELKGLSQSELSRLAGIDQSFYSRIERGIVKSPEEAAARLCRVLLPPAAADAPHVRRALIAPEEAPCLAGERLVQRVEGFTERAGAHWIMPSLQRWRGSRFVPAVFAADHVRQAAWVWLLCVLGSERASALDIPEYADEFDPWAQTILSDLGVPPLLSGDDESDEEEWLVATWRRLPPKVRAALRVVIEAAAGGRASIS
ncbi:MAG: hypothetical protein C7B45_03475 [Sulfobacillus acidophilus]|uniref:HTH cro/C1-type domain-containing protein n=1 Tax=Sulfobacillus acidophilus TaxID=53633 RepID=A0A2T2WMB5_9FIRM|nr:MAG: hypothetical protein C7B45_03475 [Sulfobacillus acidophilus]